MVPAIRVERLSKRFRLPAGRGGYGTLSEALGGLLRRRRAAGPPARDFWALRDVSFEVRPGEVVGVVGRNGAGKSTLLKVLSRIVEPTGGRAEVRGRLGSLLEVGTGFHPELSGRENVFLNGSVLGMTRREVARKFDEIVAFAGGERFLDTPVKRYSSGMYVRLAFAVAAHLEPDILIVDEVLAVGDQEFQQKCLGRMRASAGDGRTVLVVSHNMAAVQSLCTRAVVLAGGKVAFDGPPAAAVRAYLNQGGDGQAEWRDDRPPDPDRAATILAARVRSADGAVVATLPPDRPFAVEVEYALARRVTCQVSFRLNRDDGLTVLTTSDGDADGVFCRPREPGRYVGSVTVPGHLLAPGRYSLLVAVNQVGDRSIDLVDPVLDFAVEAGGSMKQLEGRLGVVLPRWAWAERAVAPGAA